MLRLALHCAGEELASRAAGKSPGVQAWNHELIRALELAMSDSGHDDSADAADWDPQKFMTAGEVATVLGLSKRQARRLAVELDGRIIGGRWLFPASAVTDYAERRSGGTARA